MKHKVFALAAAVMIVAVTADAGRVRVTHRGPRGRRTTVTVHTGFPIHRTLPNVVVRGPVIRVTPRAYLAPVVFTAAVVASIPNNPVWNGSEYLDREDGWTDFSIDVDRRGDKLFLQIDRGAAEISFAEVVFDNGEAQVVDFNERTYSKGVYSLLNFRDGRKVDHVRVVAKAKTNETEITLHLTT